MASFYAELQLEGRAYPVRLAEFFLRQATDARGRVIGKVRQGPLRLTLDVPDHDATFEHWAATAYKPLAGQVVFYNMTAQVPHETIAFAAGQCVGYLEDFDDGRGNTGPAAYICHLTITAPAFELKAGGPALPLAPAAARQWAERAAETPTPGLGSTPGLPTAAGWLVDLETVMGPDAGVRTLVASWVAGGLSEQKLKSAMRGAVDKRLVFERLRNALDASKKGKGIYVQRVVIDDYNNIPGINQTMYVPNGLPQLAIPASHFGVADAAFDLPDFNAPTFTGSARLVELKPGETLYRVTNDPSISEFAKVGGYWTRTPPAGLAEVIGGTAVMPEWNNFQCVYEFTVPPYTSEEAQEPKFYAWEGPTAAQAVSGDFPDKIENGYSLPGGSPQVFIPEIIRRNDKYNFGSSIKDVTHLHKSW